jgi:hypothetical protein
MEAYGGRDTPGAQDKLYSCKVEQVFIRLSFVIGYALFMHFSL